MSEAQSRPDGEEADERTDNLGLVECQQRSTDQADQPVHIHVHNKELISNRPSTSPALPSIDKIFNGKLVALQVNAIKCQYLLAALSTLGGAYHLCHNPVVALKIAKRQERLACFIGSFSHFLRSKTYQAVNYFLLGKPMRAFRLLRSCKAEAVRTGNEEMIAFIEASEAWVSSCSRMKLTCADVPKLTLS